MSAVATRAMRQIVVDHARTRTARKRGGGAPMLVLGEQHETGSFTCMEPAAIDAERRLALCEALARLEAANERPARVVELRWRAALPTAG